MKLIADILMVAGALGAAIYCFVLSRRLSRFNSLESGVGGAVAVLSSQVTELSDMLNKARKESSIAAEALQGITTRAEGTAERLELMLAAMHDLPQEAETRNGPEEPMFKRHPDQEIAP